MFLKDFLYYFGAFHNLIYEYFAQRVKPFFRKFHIKKHVGKSSNNNNYIFNSKLYFDLDIEAEKNGLDAVSQNNTEGSDTSFEAEEINCLSNELIEELDNTSESPKEKEKDNQFNIINGSQNIIDSLISLANNGYEFKPKNFNPSFTKSSSNANNIYFNQMIKNNGAFLLNQINKINKGNIISNKRGQKQDWICAFCNNLNFSFRTKCNRCKVKKEESNKRKNILINFGL